MNNNFEKNLEDRLITLKNEKKILLEQIKTLDVKIKTCVSRIGDKPRETPEELDKLIKQTEFSHTTASNLANKDEREFMRNLENLNRKKKNYTIYVERQRELDEYKKTRSDAFDDLRAKEKALVDISLGLKRLRLANKLNVQPLDIIEKTFEVSENHLSKVIGKHQFTFIFSSFNIFPFIIKI